MALELQAHAVLPGSSPAYGSFSQVQCLRGEWSSLMSHLPSNKRRHLTWQTVCQMEGKGASGKRWEAISRVYREQ